MKNKYRSLLLIVALGISSWAHGEWDYSYDVYGEKVEQAQQSNPSNGVQGVSTYAIGDEDLPDNPGKVPVADGLVGLLLTAGVLSIIRRRKRE